MLTSFLLLFRAGRKRHSTLTEERDVQQAYVDRYKAVARSMRAILPKPTLKDAAGLWVRFQKQHERGAGSSDRASSSPVASPRGEVGGVLYPEESSTKSSVPAVSVASHPFRSVVGPSQPLVSPRAPAPAALPAIAAGPLLINFRDLTPIPIGTKVEALYGSESAWFPGTVTRIVPSQLNNGSSVSSQSIAPRKKKVETQVDERTEEVLYHVQYDDGDEETCSRGKIKVPEYKEKQPGVLAVGQELHAECTTVGSTLRGVVLAGPFRSSEGLIQAEGAGAGTGGGAGPEDGYDVEFYTDDEKTKKVIERVKRKNITAPHLSAALVAELKEREAEKNEEITRQAALATRQVVVKQPSSSSRAHRTECMLSARREGLVSVALSRGEGPLHGLIGEVLRVDKHRRMMHVQLLDLRSLDYYIIELPYDHPRLLWFAFDPMDSDDTPDSVEHIQDLEESSIPTLNEAGEGYYVSYPVPGSNIERCAQVLSVSSDKRTIEVYYQDVVNGLASDVTETLPYDLKELTWYKDESLEGQPALLSWVAQPALKDATGYFVEVRSLEPDAEKGDMFSGEVVGVDEEARIILVSFDCAEGSEVNDTDEEDVEMIPYDSPDIVWVSPPLCATSLVPKPPVASAVGYIVNVFDESRTSKNGPKNIIQGKIMSINESNETVRVRFKNGNPDELFPMESMQIAWISEAPPSFLSQSLVSRPKLPHAVGYEVEVSFREAGDEKGQSLHGEVVSFDKEANTVRVRFQGSDEAELGANCEDLEYFSADIAWIRKVGPIFARSLVPRPSLVDAVGYRVDVKSHQPDHDPNDVFVGEIVSVNAAAGTMRVRFDGPQGSAGDEDEEEFDYTSPDVAWMERSPATGDEFSGLPIYQQSHEKTPEGKGANKGSITAGSINGEDLIASTSKKPAITAGRRASREEPDTLQSALPRPSMQSAVGYDVAVLDIGGELAEGVVCAVDMQRRALLILFHERIAVAPSAVTSGVTGREHYYAFESSAVAWMREPTPCLLSLSQVPRPPIALCVGYEVDVKSHDPGAEDDDVFLGTVVSVSPLIRAIHVVFKGVGGAQADEEALCYDSKDIAWRQPPRLVPNPRPASAATAPTTDGAVSAEGTTRLDQSNFSKPQSAETSGKRRPPPLVPPQRAIKWDLLESKKPTSPPPLDAAVGRHIVVCDIDGDMRGKVVGVSRKMLQIKLLDEDDVEDDEVIELQYSSLSIRWFQDKDKEGGG
jgi:ribosomal protein L35AE/L33A